MSAPAARMLRASYQEGKALALYGSNLSLDSISQHLVTLNKVMTPYGESLFRYADSASLGTLGASLTASRGSKYSALLRRFMAVITIPSGHFGPVAMVTRPPCRKRPGLCPWAGTTSPPWKLTGKTF